MENNDKKILLNNKKINDDIFNDNNIESELKKTISKKVFSFNKSNNLNNINVKQNKDIFDLDYIIENIDSFSVNQLKKSIKSLAYIIKKN